MPKAPAVVMELFKGGAGRTRAAASGRAREGAPSAHRRRPAARTPPATCGEGKEGTPCVRQKESVRETCLIPIYRAHLALRNIFLVRIPELPIFAGAKVTVNTSYQSLTSFGSVVHQPADLQSFSCIHKVFYCNNGSGSRDSLMRYFKLKPLSLF